MDGIEHVALALYPRGKHLGLLYRVRAGVPIHIAHLCWHHRLVNVPADPTKILFWISLDLDQDQAEQVAAQCREVGRAGVGRFFPYANSSPRGFFLNERLEFIYGAGSLGLTCASFVLAVFNFVGIDLVNYDSWPIRPGDEQWLEKI
ncbi:MAG TPA: hypothetical protein VH518_16240, partial [Tepidisphaeraceae bacterium]